MDVVNQPFTPYKFLDTKCVILGNSTFYGSISGYFSRNAVMWNGLDTSNLITISRSYKKVTWKTVSCLSVELFKACFLNFIKMFWVNLIERRRELVVRRTIPQGQLGLSYSQLVNKAFIHWQHVPGMFSETGRVPVRCEKAMTFVILMYCFPIGKCQHKS